MSFLIAFGIVGAQAVQVTATSGETIQARYEVDLLGRSRVVFALPAGPRTIQTFRWIPDPDSSDDWRSVRVRLIWDGDDPDTAGVDVPLGRFVSPAEGRSASSQSEYLNQRPMPYRRSGRLVLDAEGSVRGSIRLKTVPGIDRLDERGYLRSSLANQEPGTPRGNPRRFSERSENQANSSAASVRYWYDRSPGPRTP